MTQDEDAEIEKNEPENQQPPQVDYKVEKADPSEPGPFFIFYFFNVIKKFKGVCVTRSFQSTSMFLNPFS